MTDGTGIQGMERARASRLGVRLGVDVGSVRVGLAASDPSGLLASPVETVARDPRGDRDPRAPSGPGGCADQHRIAEVAAEREAIEVVVGLPRSLSGGEGTAAGSARSYAVQLAALLDPTPVRLVDERLTTVDAHRRLRESGVAGRAHRAVIDQAAAVLILQGALDAERASGRAPGELVEPVSAGGAPRRRRKTRPGRSEEPVPGSVELVGSSTGGDDGVTQTEEPRP